MRTPSHLSCCPDAWNDALACGTAAVPVDQHQALDVPLGTSGSAGSGNYNVDAMQFIAAEEAPVRETDSKNQGRAQQEQQQQQQPVPPPPPQQQEKLQQQEEQHPDDAACGGAEVAAPAAAILHVAHQGGTGSAPGAVQGRIRWEQHPQLHARFVVAVGQLGGPDVAQPRGILALLRGSGLTAHQVKSHLQQYRLSLKLNGSAGQPSSVGKGGSAAEQPSRKRSRSPACSIDECEEEDLTQDCIRQPLRSQQAPATPATVQAIPPNAAFGVPRPQCGCGLQPGALGADPQALARLVEMQRDLEIRMLAMNQMQMDLANGLQAYGRTLVSVLGTPAPLPVQAGSALAALRSAGSSGSSSSSSAWLALPGVAASWQQSPAGAAAAGGAQAAAWWPPGLETP